MGSIEKHHVLFPKKLHRVYTPNREIREKMTVPLEHDVHTRLHKELGMVAVLPYLMATYVNNRMRGAYSDGREAVDDYQGYLAEAMSSPSQRVEDISIARQTLEAIERQRRYFDQ